MADDNWVDDVRRWYFAGVRASMAHGMQLGSPDGSRPEHEPMEASMAELGYEAAQPVLQASHWPDAPVWRGTPRR